MFSTMQILGKTPLLKLTSTAPTPSLQLQLALYINWSTIMSACLSSLLSSRFIIQDSSSFKIHHAPRFIIPQDSSSLPIHHPWWFIFFHDSSTSKTHPWLCLLSSQKGSHMLYAGEVVSPGSPLLPHWPMHPQSGEEVLTVWRGNLRKPGANPPASRHV